MRAVQTLIAVWILRLVFACIERVMRTRAEVQVNDDTATA